MLLLLSVDFFKSNFLKKDLSECQMVLNLIRTNRTLVLIWAQTVCKGYVQATKVPASNLTLYSTQAPLDAFEM